MTTLLTPRELEVIALLAAGLSPKEIARKLGVSTHTVRQHTQHARNKTDCATNVQLAVMVAKNGG